MIADLLDGLFEANLAGSAAILLVLLLRGPIRRGFGARAAYALWALVPAAAAASLAPKTTDAAWFEASSAVVQAMAVVPARPEIGTGGAGFMVVLWIAGLVASLLIMAKRQSSYVSALGRLTPAEIRGRRVLKAERGESGPSVVGAMVVVPADFEQRYSMAEQEAILAHEQVHLRRGDVAANGIWALGQCLCWFNPLVHLAAYQARLDQELACDATVVAKFPVTRRLYAEALLKTQLGGPAPPVGCTWPSRAPNPLRERIALLGKPEPGPARRALGGAVLAALVAWTGFSAWAAQPGRPLIEEPDWIRRPSGDEMIAYYPAEAAARRDSGWAVVECRVVATGVLRDCQTRESSTPAFGAAALAMAPAFQMKAQQRNGRPTANGMVRIPIRFAMPQPK